MSISPVTKTANEIAVYVKRQFGDESGVQITDADIYRWLSSAQLQVVAKIAPVQAIATTDVVAGTREVDLSMLPIHQIDSVHFEGRFIPQVNFAEAEQRIYTSGANPNTADSAEFWYSYANTLYLFPVPSRSITGGLSIHFIKMPTPVLTGTDLLSIPDKYFDALCSWILSKAYELDEEFDQAANYRQHFENQLLEQNGEERSMANMTYPVITYLGD